MRRIILVIGLTCALWFSLVAQETKPVSIVEVAELTLTESPVIKQNFLTIKQAKGSLRVQNSLFDYNLFTSTSITRNSLNLFQMDPKRDLTEGNLNTRGLISSVGIAKRFRSGLMTDLRVNYNSIRDNFELNRFNEMSGPNIADHFMSSSLLLTQPLMRGRGIAVATALEKSAQLSLASARSNLSFANSTQVLNTATAYWQYLGAFKSAEIYKQNEARVRKVLAITEDLVQGDKKPKADLDQVRADLANQVRLNHVATQSLIAARMNLGRAIGLSEENSKLIGVPIDDFPTVENSGYKSGISPESLKELARENRKDIEANELTQESLAWQLRSADNNRKPQFDLVGALNYGGSGMGNGWANAWSPFTNTQGRDVGFELGLRFNFPVNNNQAQGAYAQSQALLMDRELFTNNLARNIDLNVSIAISNVENAVGILENAKTSLNYSLQVYENEQVKFRNGLTTLLNLILFQDRLTFAQLDYLQARLGLAMAIASLRFETGTLYAYDDLTTGATSFNQNIFYTIPRTN